MPAPPLVADCDANAAPPAQKATKEALAQPFTVVAVQTLHRTQGRWIITDTGRMKMVHDGSQRNKDWAHPTKPTYQDVAPRALVCGEFEGNGDFHIEVNLNGKHPGFEVDEETMTISSIDTHSMTRCPLEVGDRVVAVDEKVVTTFKEYKEATTNVLSFVMTCRPNKPASGEDVTKLSHQGMEHDLTHQARSCIEFDVAEVICKENQGTVEVPVRRVGHSSQRLVLPWKTHNCNVAPHVFEKIRSSGEVVFEAGETLTTIAVDVPSNPIWNVESLFVVYFDSEGIAKEDHGGVQVALGDNVQVNVFSLNRVSFPANAYGPLADMKTNVSEFKLMCKFFEHNFSELPWETKVGLFLCFIPPLLHFFQQLMFECLVNCALMTEDVEECKITGVDWAPLFFGGNVGALWSLTVSFFVLRILEHLTEVRYRMLKLGGKTLKLLRTNMFSTMLQISDRGRAAFDEGDVHKAMDTEVAAAVNLVWLNIFKMLRMVLDLCVKMCMTIRIAMTLPVMPALILSGMLPALAVGVLLIFTCRRHQQLKLNLQEIRSEEDWSAFATMCRSSSPLIVMYRRSWFFTKSFAECHGFYNAASYSANAYSHDTLWMLKYFLIFAESVVILRGGLQVQSGRLALGSFLVLHKAITGFGKDMQSMCALANTILTGMAAVTKIAAVLNSPTRKLERFQKQHGDMDAARAAASASDIVISLEGVHFTYPGTQVGQGEAMAPTNLKLPTGHLVCLPVSPNLGAKQSLPGIHTLFSLIAGNLVPDGGRILVPPRWRVVYVPVTPILFDGTLMYNLMFSDRAQDEEAAWEVCRALGMSPELIGQSDFDVGIGGQALKFSDRMIVSITRALMHDVDFLLLSSGLDVLGENRGVKVLRYLRKYCSNRGLPHERRPKEIRHIKTVLFTSKFKMLQDQAAFKIDAPPKLDLA